VFTWQIFEVSPGEQSCDGVVIHVQKRHLVLFLPQNKENLQQIIFCVIGIERNVLRYTFNRYSVITQFLKLAAGEQV
jgi:hypothetical protein